MAKLNNMGKLYKSRKFILFSFVTFIAMVGWVYCLLYKPDLLSAVSTFVIAVIGGYGGCNLVEKNIAVKSQKLLETNKK